MIETFQSHRPALDPTAWVHSTALLMGQVTLAAGANVWPGCVLRGDEGAITIGQDTNIQDLTVVHSTRGLSETVIGPRVTVGHRAILHGCQVLGDSLVGMGAILLDNSVIEPGCIIGAGALIPVGRRIPARSLVMGTPGRVVRQVTDEELETVIEHSWREYLRLVAAIREG